MTVIFTYNPDEDWLIAELRLLGLTYLAPGRPFQVDEPRPVHQLLAALAGQASVQLQTTLIPVFLLHPVFADDLCLALGGLDPADAQLLKIYYSAAVTLQVIFETTMREIQGKRFQWLPSVFDKDLAVPDGLNPREALEYLGCLHQQQTRSSHNWSTIYEHAARKMIRRKRIEAG